VRRVTTLLTAGGMALVVFVFATVLMMGEGIRATLVATGQPDNVLLLRKGAGAEINSGIERAKAAMVESLDGIATNGEGRRLVSKEPVVLINLPKRSNGKPSNVTVRGTSALGLELRPQVRVIEGRMFRPGTSEIIAGRSVASGFRGAALGETLRFAQRDWVVVGVFDSKKTAFDSEIWGDAEQMMAAFRRPVYSTLVLRLNQREALAGLKAAIEADPRLQTCGAGRRPRRHRLHRPPGRPPTKEYLLHGALTPLQAAACAGPWAGAMPTSWPPCATKWAPQPTRRWS
jgi:putative ABC transport system permease protein